MIVDFGGYEPYQPKVPGLYRDLSRRDARNQYNDVMERREERIEQLAGLVGRNGVTFGRTDEALLALGEWYVTSVTPDQSDRSRLSPVWFAVSFDIALLLGEIMIQRVAGLRWEFYVWGKTDMAYQRHVIMGFHTPDPRMNIDPQRVISVIGHRAMNGTELELHAFVGMVQGARKLWDEYPPSGETIA